MGYSPNNPNDIWFVGIRRAHNIALVIKGTVYAPCLCEGELVEGIGIGCGFGEVHKDTDVARPYMLVNERG
jgi:hypothetical protein